MSKQAGVRVAIITGTSSGIGQSAAIRIAERGAGGGIRDRDVFWDVSDFVRASGWYLMVSMSSDW